MKARRGVEVLFYSFFNLGVGWGWVINVTTRPLYPRESDPVPTVQEAGLTKDQCGRVRKISPPSWIQQVYTNIMH